MARYDYCCTEHGAVEVNLPMGQAANTVACPVCGGAAVRVFSAPMTATNHRNTMALIDHAERSRSEPDVVTSLPPRDPRKRTPMAPLNPALQRLPRP